MSGRGERRTRRRARSLRLHLQYAASSAEEVSGTMGGSTCKAMLAVDRHYDHAVRTVLEWARLLHAAEAAGQEAAPRPWRPSVSRRG